MTLANRATVSLVFEDGSEISAWTKVSIHDDYTDPLADIQLECRPPREQILDYQTKLAKGQQVTLKINGVSQRIPRRLVKAARAGLIDLDRR